MRELKIAVVCSSNQNRSMEAHNFLKKRGFNVQSFGSGNCVKLPGPSLDKPNLYTFDTAYDDMYKDLAKKDKNLYTQNGILSMLDRNRRLKKKPEKFQASRDQFDVIITCDERVYDQVIEDVQSREKAYNEPVHVINIEIQDNHEDATVGAFIIVDLCTILQDSNDLDNDIDEIIQDFEEKCQRPVLHTVDFM